MCNVQVLCILKFMLLWSARKKPTQNQKATKAELDILLSGCCKGGTKPIDGAIMLGNKGHLLLRLITLLQGMQYSQSWLVLNLF